MLASVLLQSESANRQKGIDLRVSDALSRTLREVGDVLLESDTLLLCLDPSLRLELFGLGEILGIGVHEIGGLRNGSL